MEAAFDLDGAFNDVTLSLLRGVDPAGVIDRLDRLLERYGGIGAIARKDQLSKRLADNVAAAYKAHKRRDVTFGFSGNGSTPARATARPPATSFMAAT